MGITTQNQWMNCRSHLGLVVAAALVCVVSGCTYRAQPGQGHRGAHKRGAFEATLAGERVRIVAVSETGLGGDARVADHAWTPDGAPYEGPEARLVAQSMASTPGEGLQRCVYFEFEGPPSPIRPGMALRFPTNPESTGSIDIFAYLPANHLGRSDADDRSGAVGPLSVTTWGGSPRDSTGHEILPMPASVGISLGVGSGGVQPIAVGIAKGEYKDVATVSVSAGTLQENETAILASGSWGRLEVTHLRRPEAESKPSPTHRFRLVGGESPPKVERRALFYSAAGTVLTTCSDNANGSGFFGAPVMGRASVADVARVVIQERPYAFVQFEGVCFDAPQVTGYSGTEGDSHRVSSAVGTVVGVLKPTKDGAWAGALLYAPDGTRWLDPGRTMAPYEFGMFDPWDHPLDTQRSILFEPRSPAPSSSLCEVYAADSADGPRRERLTLWNELPLRMPMSAIPCHPTKRPFMRLEVRAGSGIWKSLDRVSVTPLMVHASESGSPGSRILEVFFDATGAIRIWKDESNPVPAKARWRPGEQVIRAMAHLRDGETVVVNFNMAASSGAQSPKELYRGFEYTRQSNGTIVQAGTKSIALKDVAYFDLQVQDLQPAVVIVVRAPIRSEA